MSQNLNGAVQFLADVVEINSIASTSPHRVRIEAFVGQLIPIALDDLERFLTEFAIETQAAEDRKIAGEEAAERHRVAEEERLVREAAQEEVDQAEREQRQRDGIS